MEIHGFTESGSIDATIDGMRVTVPDDLSNRHRRMIAEWEAQGNTIPSFDPGPTSLQDAIAAKLAELDDYRWKQEVGGAAFAGTMIRTDWNSQAKVTAAYTMAKLDPGYSIPTWEVVPGVFMPLDNATIVAMGEAVRDHVQETFNRKAVLHSQIAALETIDAVLAYDIPTEWNKG